MPDPASKPRNAGPRDPLVGATLGDYKNVGVLGRGGFATVYRAQQTKLNREVALKVLNQGKSGLTEDQVDSFLREARAAAALNHPSLVHVHDVGKSGGRYFLSMELVPGGDLAKRVKNNGPMPWREAVAIIRDVASALACAHASGMVHRDVKPANMLITSSGKAKLADLGLTDSSEHAGTAAFMPPEQILRKQNDARSDLYSLGCSLYSLITGRPPFQGSSNKQILARQINERPSMMKHLGFRVPTEVERLVSRLLAKDPAERPQSAAEVIEAIDRLESGGPHQASRAQRLRRVRRQRARSGASPETKAIVIVIVVLVLIAAAVWGRQLLQK